MSSNDDALIEKAVEAINSRLVAMQGRDVVPEVVRTVLDAIGDDLRAEGWDTAIADATWSDGRWVTTGPIEAGMVNPYRRERA